MHAHNAHHELYLSPLSIFTLFLHHACEYSYNIVIQVTLIKSYTLGYIRLFGREDEVVKPEVQTITLRSNNALGGSFTLNFTDSLGTSSLTGERGPGSALSCWGPFPGSSH